MNISELKRVDFGAVGNDEYDVLCATSFDYQGRAWKGNYEYAEIKDGLYSRERTAAVFEFPSDACIEGWLLILPRYFGELREECNDAKSP